MLTGIVSAVGQEMISPGISSSARLTPDIKLLYNPQMKSAYNFVPGVIGIDFDVDLRNDDFYLYCP